MSDKQLYQKKKQAQLSEWQAEIDKMKAQASEASADVQLATNKRIRALESKIEEGRVMLSELGDASEATWESSKIRVESTWDSLKTGLSEAAAKFNK